MKFSIIASPCGEDVLLRLDETPGQVIHRIVMARHELQELKVAIEKYQEGQPARNLREGRGHE